MDGVWSDGEGEFVFVPLHHHHFITVINIVAFVILITVILKLCVRMRFQRVGLSFCQKGSGKHKRTVSFTAAIHITSLCCWWLFFNCCYSTETTGKNVSIKKFLQARRYVYFITFVYET